jgi:hypothetical protein
MVAAAVNDLGTSGLSETNIFVLLNNKLAATTGPFITKLLLHICPS